MSDYQWSRKLGINPKSNLAKDSNVVRDAFSLNTQYYKVWSKGKMGQSRERLEPSPTPQYHSYWKGKLQFTLDHI